MRRKRSQAGFTMIEVMIAVLLTAIAVVGVVGLYRVQTRSAGYSRYATEASVLAADRLEQLRTIAIAVPIFPAVIEPNLDSRGQATPGGMFTRSYTAVDESGFWKLTVTVSWDDDGVTRNVTLHSLRSP